MKIAYIGDPHLGRKFKVGVPHNMLGVREEKIFSDFEQELESIALGGIDLCVCMGDLFDSHSVDNQVVERAHHIYTSIAQTYPETEFVILKGNHDWHRDHRHVSSFDIFASMIEPFSNITAVSKPDVWNIKGEHYGMFPWMPPEPRSALQWAQEVPLKMFSVKIVFGHWDSAWSDHNLIPAGYLKSQGVEFAYSGHDHVANTETRSGLKVIWTGSFQPYSRGEDPKGTVYKRISLKEYMELPLDTVIPYCFTVELKPWEELPHQVWSYENRVSVLYTDEGRQEKVSYTDELDLKNMWNNTVQQMPDSVRDDVKSLYSEHME